MNDTFDDLSIELLIGKTMAKVEAIEDKEIVFTTSDGEKYRLFHEQDCCETVVIESIVGDLKDLVGSPILSAEEAISVATSTTDEFDNSTWTFYKLATIKGYVDIRWHGSSNGYYSESVDFERIQ